MVLSYMKSNFSGLERLLADCKNLLLEAEYGQVEQLSREIDAEVRSLLSNQETALAIEELKKYAAEIDLLLSQARDRKSKLAAQVAGLQKGAVGIKAYKKV